MTLGLAVADKDTIYLAIESEGLPTVKIAPSTLKLPGPRSLVLDSKLIKLQGDPAMCLLAGGGLEHWCDVVAHYNPQPSLSRAAEELKRLLEQFTRLGNQAFGRLCGYAGESSICIRLDRGPEDDRVNIGDSSPLDRCAFMGDYAKESAYEADELIRQGTHPLRAIVETIQGKLQREHVRPPIHVAVSRRPI